MFGCNIDNLLAEKYTLKFFFCPKSERKYERVPPGHLIILLKSNKFNMATTWVKGCIVNFSLFGNKTCECILTL